MSIPLSASYLRIITGVRFNNSYEHTRWFDNSEQQLNYFASKEMLAGMDDASFIRKDMTYSVRVPYHVDNLLSANYLYFNNPSVNSKTYFCFVTGVEYVNSQTSIVNFTVDVIQTFMFNITFRESFITREHQNRWNSDGSPVINLIPEDLDYGTSYDNVLMETFGWDIAFMVIQMKSDFNDNTIKSSWCGIPQPLMNIVYPFKLDGSNLPAFIDGDNTTFYNPSDLLNILYTNPDTVNNVTQIYITDRCGLNCSYDGSTLSIESSGALGAHYAGMDIGGINVVHVESQRKSSTNTHNNGSKYKAFNVSESKLLMHPYSLITLDDFRGNRIDVKLEDIKSDNLIIEIVGSMGSSNKVAYNIENYNNSSSTYFSNMEYSLINESTNDVPIISDYAAAFAQGNSNAVKNKVLLTSSYGAFNVLQTAFKQIVEIPMRHDTVSEPVTFGDTKLAAGKAAASLLTQRAKLMDIANVPPTSGKQGGNAHFDYGFNIHNCFILHKTIKPEYKTKLTEYFQVFGYKVNRFGLPNLKTRQSWNYIELEKANIVGNIPNDYITIIRNVFEKGITLWHNDDLLNYSLSNNEI